MSTPGHRFPTTRPEDLEETAELPTLVEGAASNSGADETHVMPAFDPLAGTDAWQVSFESAPAGDHLDDKLRALTQSLRDLQDRLQSKSEQLSVFEREVGARDQRIAILEQQLATLGEQLQASETLARTRSEELRRIGVELHGSQQAQREQHVTSQRLESERAAGEVARKYAETLALQAQRRHESHGETLQTLEVRRQLFESMVEEGELQLAQAAARCGELEQQLAGLARVTAARAGEQDTALQAERIRVEQLRQQLGDTQQQLATLQAQLQQAAAGGAQQQADGEARMAMLQTEMQQLGQQLAQREAMHQQQLNDHVEAVGTLRELLEAERSRGDTALGDLAAAEERIRDAEQRILETERRLQQHADAEAALRQQLLQTRESLDQRNDLIGRLEHEASSSVEVLGSIQQNLRRLDSRSVPSPASAQAPPDAIVRLLVRTEGDTGIVHVLGRHTTIGRTPDNDLRIDADFISRHHAVVLITPSGTIIEDLGSTNGVYINGRRISRAALKEGDKVVIGRSVFRYVHKPAVERNG